MLSKTVILLMPLSSVECVGCPTYSNSGMGRCHVKSGIEAPGHQPFARVILGMNSSRAYSYTLLLKEIPA